MPGPLLQHGARLLAAAKPYGLELLEPLGTGSSSVAQRYHLEPKSDPEPPKAAASQSLPPGHHATKQQASSIHVATQSSGLAPPPRPQPSRAYSLGIVPHHSRDLLPTLPPRTQA